MRGGPAVVSPACPVVSVDINSVQFPTYSLHIATVRLSSVLSQLQYPRVILVMAGYETVRVSVDDRDETR